MKKSLFSLALIFLSVFVFAQDLIYTVSGELNENKTALDSILVENLTNETRILFGNLPPQENYQINLTKNAYWGTVGINDFNVAPAFVVAANSPGLLTINYTENSPVNIRLSVFTISGQRVYISEQKAIIARNSIRVILSNAGVFFVRIEAPSFTQTFKAIGADNVSKYAMEIADQFSSGIITKSGEVINNGDFSFIPGDSIRFSVYKEGYFASPISKKVLNSGSVNFLFEIVRTVPTVTTFVATDITITSAKLNGEVTADGNATITQRGFYWSKTDTTPSVADSLVTVSGTTGSYNITVSSLTPNTTYYYLAFATNSKGTATDVVQSFNTEEDHEGETGTFTDTRDNKTYTTVIIDGKELMSENLAYLPSVNPASVISFTEPYYYVSAYQDTIVSEAKATDNYSTYGVLYNWPAAKVACPDGWHLPFDDEWEQLAQYVSDQKGPYSKSGDEWNNVGTHLKATSGWSSDGNGTDDFGFSGLPGGFRGTYGEFYSVGYHAYWWSATEFSTNFPWLRSMFYDNTTFVRNFRKSSHYGFSVRCVKD